VLKRAFANHLDKLIVTGTTLQDSTDLVPFVSSNGDLTLAIPLKNEMVLKSLCTR